MSNIWGRNLRISIFGESHGEGTGIVIDGLPAGYTIDQDEIKFHMGRRAPGKSPLSTSRLEADQAEIFSGMFNGVTTGAPLCGIIRNHDVRSQDYKKDMPRPGTADLTAHIKYKGYNDYRGAGHFSGRLTAPLTFAGSVARQFLESKKIYIGAHILQIGSHKDIAFNDMDRDVDPELLDTLAWSEFPLLDETKAEDMKKDILKAVEEKDSVGGIVECAAVGHPAGLGSPFFESLESNLASMIFSIPATKGIEFGLGFRMADMRGSDANDAFYYESSDIVMRTNHSGGFNGGLTNGMPILFNTVFRPTASIGKSQSTVDLSTGENRMVTVTGRHDPCIVPRAVVVVESALAICLMDSILEVGWQD
ncbi:MAG: chorismate synthase [Anaerovoracaceae bacterium]